ncbi:MAG: DDE-type integrase/transposase/recombinase [Acidimicrobiales bacterium]
MARDPAEALALWRYHLIAEALDPRLSGRERGLLVRAIAGEHTSPRGEPRQVSRNTLDRWIRRYRAEGLAGLRDRPRSDHGSARISQALLDEAIRLRLEQPARSAAHIAEIVRSRHGVRIAERTLAEQFRRRGLTRGELLRDGRTFGRYEADAPNERWIGDVLVGPFVPHPRAPGSVRARLFVLVDDHSRLLVHGRWAGNETLRAGQEVLHAAILRRGLPESLYVDNGAAYAGAELARSCAILAIRLIHSRPYAPQGRGKQERLNRIIRERFLLEATQVGIASLDELNDRFLAWVERYLNVRVHTETGESPLARYAKGTPRPANPELLRSAFLWSAHRRVSRTATVSFEGNEYEVEAGLAGRTVELRYRPEDLFAIEVWWQGRQQGWATPRRIARHVHRQAPPAPAEPVPATGIDYLGQVLADHEAAVSGSIAYRAVPGAPAEGEPC